MVFAFSNTHDLSWGTKEDESAPADLGSVQGSGKAVEVELLAEQYDIDQAYGQALDNLKVRRPTEEVKVSGAKQLEQEMKDYYVSCSTVFAWKR